jgi:hypothetical protein
MLTNAGKESFGFRPFHEERAITASFHSIHVFGIHGVAFDDPMVPRITATLKGVSFSFSVGTSLNAIARELIDDDFTDDEGAWARKHSCSPPYALVHFGPTSPYTCSTGYAQDHDGGLITYDAFPFAKDELRSAADKVLPSLVTAVSSVLSSRDYLVRLTRVYTATVGVTDAGISVRDIRLTMSATATVAKRVATDVLTEQLARATIAASLLNPKVARFFHLALEERDPLKRFLYFFLTIEVHTHATFALIDHSSALAMLVSTDERTAGVVLPFLAEQREYWRTLRGRFAWCVACKWTHLSQLDVETFGHLKSIRDQISHGVIASPSASDVTAVERLATLIQA